MQAGRFSISSVIDNPTSGSSSASPTRSRFSIERIEAPPLASMLSNESDKSSESATGRFSVNPISDVVGHVHPVGQTIHPSENVEIMSGNVSSTVSSGGNNTPYTSGTPTSTVYPPNAKQADRYFIDILAKGQNNMSKIQLCSISQSFDA